MDFCVIGGRFLFVLVATLLVGCAHKPGPVWVQEQTFAVATPISRILYIDTLGMIHADGGGYAEIEQPEWEIDKLVLAQTVASLEKSSISAVPLNRKISRAIKPHKKYNFIGAANFRLSQDSIKKVKNNTDATSLLVITSYSADEPVYGSTYQLRGGFGLLQKRSLRGRHSFAYVVAQLLIYDLTDGRLVDRGVCKEYIKFGVHLNKPEYWHSEEEPLPKEAQVKLKEKLEKVWKVCVGEALADMGLAEKEKANLWLN